jgi:hypothetical protein
MENNVLLGATGDVVAQYDNSGVVQPGSSSAPVDTSVSTDTTTTTTTETAKSATPWILYLGGAIVFYYLILNKKK